MGSDSAYGEPFYKESKAWRVDALDGDESTIIFAGTRGKARSLGAQALDRRFMDVEARRAGWADGLASDGASIDWDDKEAAEEMRMHGWWRGEYPYKRCKVCGCFEWDVLPLSRLVDGVCGYCMGEA